MGGGGRRVAWGKKRSAGQGGAVAEEEEVRDGVLALGTRGRWQRARVVRPGCGHRPWVRALIVIEGVRGRGSSCSRRPRARASGG